MDDSSARSTAAKVAVIVAPFGLSYFMAYLFRSVNAVVAPDLVRDLGLTATGLGLLTAAYFFAFAAAQLPLGVMLDRFGPRRVQAGMLLFAVSGALLFSLAENVATLTLARGMVGLGAAGGLMSSFKAVSLWFRREQVPFYNGLVMAFGGLGALVASAPADFAVRLFGWRTTFGLLAAVTLLVAAILMLIVPERAGGQAAVGARRLVADLGRIYSDRWFWRMAPLIVSTCGCQLAIQTLWAGPWLRDVAGLDRAGVALNVGAIAVGFMVGMPLMGLLATRLQRHGIDLVDTMVGLMVVLLLFEGIVVVGGSPWPVVDWFVLGFLGQGGVLAYARMPDRFGMALGGRATTAMNLMVFSTAFAAQYAIGGVIDLWPTGPSGQYHPTGYQTAFGAALAVQIAGLAWYIARRPRPGASAFDPATAAIRTKD
jgi:MFS family permease